METLKPLIDKLISAIENGYDITKEQLPDVIHQLLVWRMTEAILFAVVFWLFFSVCVYYTPRAWRNTVITDDAPVILVTLLPGVGFLIGALSNTMTALKIYVAPKLYLLESLRDFLK